MERSPRKILAIKIRPLSETMMLTATLRELARAVPAAEIHVVANERWAGLLEGLPFIHRVWPIERHPRKVARARSIARLGLELRREKFDWAMGFHGSPSIASLAFAAGARRRAVHFHGHRDPTGLTNVAIPRRMHATNAFQKDLDVLRAFGLAVGTVNPDPVLALTREELDDAEGRLCSAGISGPRLGLALGGNRPSKIWPLGNFVELGRNWCEKTNGSIVVVTKEGDEEVLGRFRELAKGRIPRMHFEHGDADKTDPRRMASAIARLNVLAANDTGPRHLAVAAQVPSLTFFGPEEPFDWHPYDRARHPVLFTPKLPCRKAAKAGEPAWCGITVCTAEKHRCLAAIPPSQALDHCLALTQESHKETRAP